MCYSAQIEADFRKFEREYGAILSLRRFVELFWEKRRDGGWQKIPKAMRDAFRHPRSNEEGDLLALIGAADREQAEMYQAELFRQKTRLAVAERTLAEKPTKKAANDKRIALDKMATAQRNLADLLRDMPQDSDARIFPGHYAPVMIAKDGQRWIVPMRYQCRLPGWTAAMEKQKPGTYNARRDNLEKVWRQLFGYRHGIMIVSRFYENVERDGRNVVLEFKPEPPHDLLVACLWSYSKGGEGEPDLFSFAAITDDPPPEMVAAGHDRCIVPIKPEHVEAWLNPDSGDLAAQHAILDDRDRPYYEHRLAA